MSVGEPNVSVEVGVIFTSSLRVRQVWPSSQIAESLAQHRMDELSSRFARASISRGSGRPFPPPSGHDEVSDLLPRVELEPFLNPDMRARYTPLSASSSPSVYLGCVEAQVLAEFAGFLEKSFAKRYSMATGMSPESVTLVEGLREEHSTADEKNLDNFHNNIAVFEGRLSMLVKARSGKLELIRGAPWGGRSFGSDRIRDSFGSSVPAIFILGYVGDSINSLAAVRSFLKGSRAIPPLLRAVADPAKREAAVFNEARIHPNVPINKCQLEALRSLRTGLEALQGPPGTGKSVWRININF